MNIYTENKPKPKPYTYLIGWSKLNIWYYGVRFAKKAFPEDLWTTYFTSSKHVKKFREEYGEPDIIEIRKTFNTSDAARKWETTVLRRMGAKNREDFLNKSDNMSISPECCGHGRGGKAGRKLSKENIDKLKEANTGKTPWNAGLSGYKINRTKPNPTKGKKSIHPAWNKGKTKNSDGMWVIADTKTTEPRVKYKWRTDKKKNANVTLLNSSCVVCSHCHKTGNLGNMKRWHFDNCKLLEKPV